MVSIQKLRIPFVLKWVPFLFSENSFRSSKTNLYTDGSHHIPKLFSTAAVRVAESKTSGNLGELVKKSRVAKREAQAALLDYLHSTRSLRFTDAENMSRNAPEFFYRLLKRVDVDAADVGRSLTRFLRYHPINEFEPFFESIGLKPSEYTSFLPRDLMFLSDDELLLENYYVLCNYGFARNRIGRIYKEAMEVFQYDYGILQSKLQSFQNLGLSHSLVVKVITSSPYLLKGTFHMEFIEVLERLKKAGVGHDLLEEHIDDSDDYNWKPVLESVCLLSSLGLSEEQLGQLITQHPDLLLEGSGRFTFRLLGFLSKFGFKRGDVQALFLQFPPIAVAKFTHNLFYCYQFLAEIKMPFEDIGWIVRLYPMLLGSCELKRVNSLLGIMNCGMRRLRQMVVDDPNVLRKWVLGVKVDRLEPELRRGPTVRMIKTDFLLSLGFVEKSKEMEKALKVFRGKGLELQERFDCLVNAGLSSDEVIAMVRVSPQILNQSKEVIETKIGFFTKELGRSVSDLVAHPAIVSYTIERVKLRLLTYKWLKDEGVVHPKLALSTLMSCSDKIFIKSYVNSHPRGLEFWARLKKEIYG